MSLTGLDCGTTSCLRGCNRFWSCSRSERLAELALPMVTTYVLLDSHTACIAMLLLSMMLYTPCAPPAVVTT